MKVFFENRQRMLESRKVRDRLDDEETFGLEREKSSYPDRLPLPAFDQGDVQGQGKGDQTGLSTQSLPVIYMDPCVSKLIMQIMNK